MSAEHKFLGLLGLYNRHKPIARSPSYGPNTLSASYSGHAQQKSNRKTKDLIKLLLVYGARAARASQPHTRVAINVYMPNGKRAVRIKLAR